MIPAVTLRREIRPFYLGIECLPPVVALAGYFDDSQDGDVFAVAGYLAPVDAWDKEFSPDWRAVLKAAPRPIKEFKASDCRHGTGEFSEWTKAERDSLTESLVDRIIDQRRCPDMFGLGIAVAVPKSLTEELRVWHQGFAYTMCFGTLVMDALVLSRRLTENDSLHLLFDYQPKMMTKAQAIFDEVRDATARHFKVSLRRPQFVDSADFPPIQAADLLAYETYKEMKNRQEKPPRDASRALRRLLEGRLHAAFYYDEAILRKLADNQDKIRAGELIEGTIKFPQIYLSMGAEAYARELKRMADEGIELR